MNRISNLLPTVAEFVDDEKDYRPGTIEAVREFARAKPWRGTIAERAAKFSALHTRLCELYGIELKLIVNVPEQEGGAGTSMASYASRREIRLLKRLSVVTYLHLFAWKIGNQSAFRWSLSIFKRCFPLSFARARQHGPYLFRS